ncbi:MAG: DUF5615 family PIN-like protein [Candidatus Rokubacteria bacterium]|nr:DUF5615 family PIN-like protein [Candidatus Rokubacteria bacterium]MBI4627906.1 DUF5615 family PIN-like protein [Candidatus Rokubacteria bacterium]
MRLLLDQNLSPRLVPALADLFPDSTRVREVGLQAADDHAVWQYAAQHGFAIVSKDADFHERSFLLGPPPKVIWIRRGNCSTAPLLSSKQKRPTAWAQQ